MLQVVRTENGNEISTTNYVNFDDCEHFIDDTVLLSKENPEKDYSVYVLPDNVLLWDSTGFDGYTCPECLTQTKFGWGRRCPFCDYYGDWIQPRYQHTYLGRKHYFLYHPERPRV